MTTLGLLVILLGALLCLTAGIGLLRFPDVLSRLHAGSKPQVLGVLLMLLGVGLTRQDGIAVWPLLLTAVFQLLTIPVGAHMVARRAYRSRTVTPRRFDVEED